MKNVSRIAAMGCQHLATVILLLNYATTSWAGQIVGGSSLLTVAYETQLETWLGQGSLTLTNIYTKIAGDTSVNFHAAVDGKGATFVVMQGSENGNSAIIGGYDPQSWDATGQHFTSADSDRTAFLFNLTLGSRYAQYLNTDSTAGAYTGRYQTWNAPSTGPSFGGGPDLRVYYDLTNGVSYLWSYGNDPSTITNYNLIDGTAYTDVRRGNYHYLTFGAIEVFSISQEPPGTGNVPEPTTLGLLALGLIGLGFARRRKQNH